MSRSGARRASTPVREPIQAHPIERSRRRAATARPGLVWPPVPPPAMTTSTTTRLFALALERELDQAVEQLAVAEPGSLPHSRVPARRGEPGDRVDLVDEDPIALEKEVHPRHAGAVDGAVRLERELADPPGRLGRKGGWHRESRLAIRVLRRVVVELARVRDLAGQGGHGLVVPEHAHLDLAAGDGAFDEDLPVVARRLVERPGQGARVADLADPDGRAEIRRLDEAGEAEGVRDPARDALGRPPPFVAGHHEVLDDGQAVGLEHRLHRRLVHPDRGGEHARADVGQVGELEEALDRAVLPVRAVEHDDDDVEVAHLGGEAPGGLGPGEARRRGAVDGLGAVGQRLLDFAGAVVRGQRDARLGGERPQGIAAHDPAPVAGDPDRHHGVAARLERRDDRGRGREGDLVLPRPAAEDDAHAQARHARYRVAMIIARATRLASPWRWGTHMARKTYAATASTRYTTRVEIQSGIPGR